MRTMWSRRSPAPNIETRTGKGAATVYEAKPLLIERNAPKISHDEHDECVSDSHTFNDDVCSTGIVAEDYQ